MIVEYRWRTDAWARRRRRDAKWWGRRRPVEKPSRVCIVEQRSSVQYRLIANRNGIERKSVTQSVEIEIDGCQDEVNPSED